MAANGLQFIKLFILMSTIVACSSGLDEEQAPGGIDGQGRLASSAQSTFVVEQVRSYSNGHFSANSEQWSDLATQNLIEIEACIRDIARANPVIDQPFVIKTPIGNQTRYTHTNGCLTWSEVIEFSILSDERYLDYSVMIEGPESYPGQYRLELAINPWPEAQRPVVDLTAQTLHTPRVQLQDLRSLEAQSSLQTEHRSSLKVSNTRFQLRSREQDAQRERIILTYEFEAQVSALRTNLAQQMSVIRLNRGLFDLRFALIEKDLNEGRPFLITEAQTQASIESGTLKTSIQFEVSRGQLPHLSSEIELYLQLTPRTPPPGLVTLRGLLDMNGLDNLKTQELASLQSRYENILNDKEDWMTRFVESFDQRNSEKDDLEFSGLAVNQLRFSPGSIINPNARTSSERVMRVITEGCLREPVLETPLRDTPVLIETLGSEVATSHQFTTNRDGCFRTHFLLSYNALDREQWLQQELKLTAQSGELHGQSLQRTILCNPWNPQDFCYDTTEHQAPELPAGPAPRLYLPQIAYSSEGRGQSNFRINRFLQMSFSKNYQIKLNPKIEFFTSHAQNQGLQALNYGNYELELFLYTPKSDNVDWVQIDLEQFHLLSGNKKTARIQASGDLITDVDLPFYFTEVASLNLKNLLVVRIKSLQDDQVSPGVFAVPFYGTRTQVQLSALELAPEQLEALDAPEAQLIVQAGVKDVEMIDWMSGVTQVDMYREQLAQKEEKDVIGLSRVELNQRPSLGQQNKHAQDSQDDLSVQEMRVLTTENGTMPNRLLKKFCRHLYPSVRSGRDSEALAACRETPREHIETIPLMHIEEILSRQTNEQGQQYGVATLVDEQYGQISHGTGFFASYGDRAHELQGEQNVTSYGRGVELFLHAPAPLLMTANSGVSQHFEVVSQRASAQMQMTFDRRYRQIGFEDLEYNMIKLGFTARIRPCVAVKASTNQTFLMHVCLENDVLKNLEEEWFFIGRNDPDRHSLLTDGSRLRNNEFTQLIRGRYHFQRLWDQYRAEDTVLVIREIAGSELLTPLLNFKMKAQDDRFMEAYNDQNYPGLMTPALPH